MDPLIATTAWQSYTPATDEVLMVNTQLAEVQIVQGALSVVTHPVHGPLVDAQGLFLRFRDSLSVVAGTAVNYRARPTNRIGGAVIGRAPQ